ncbi:hypothetical protein A3K73_02210, partial [Candidatus Pacearchaeota archaeon RBG_13_36_9]
VHIGKRQDYRKYLNLIKNTKINSAVIFPHSSDISEAGRGLITDEFSKKAREIVNGYVLSLADQVNKQSEKVYFFQFNFIWPDFDRKNLNRYLGVKWHRHDPDPKYNITGGEAEPSAGFNKLLDHLRDNKMPIIFEDDFENLKTFIRLVDRELPEERIRVIIPHLGFGTDSYEKIRKANIFERGNVYTDTSYASKRSLDAIKDYLERYGNDRIFFGSDFPFAHPKEELDRILSLDISGEAKDAITRNNILKLLGGVREKTKDKESEEDEES